MIDINGKPVSELCLGGGKMVKFPRENGHALMRTAIECGINCFDAHHRYGNCEDILGTYPDQKHLFYMTKVSAYQGEQCLPLMRHSHTVLNNKVDIMWMSDLDDKRLYDIGEDLYDDLVWELPAVGITTENSNLAIRFIDSHPECKYLMIPIFIGRNDMLDVAKYAQDHGVYVFGIKPFDDGRLLAQGYSIKQCLSFIYGSVDVLVFGTSNTEHIKNTVEAYKEIVAEQSR